MSVQTISEDDFDEEFYLSQNRDVILVKNGGFWKSAFQHYVAHGRTEGRPPNAWSHGTTVPASSTEATVPDFALDGIAEKHFGPGFLAPTELAVTALPLRRVAMIGSCFLELWQFHEKNPSNCPVDLIVMNNVGQLPDRPADGFDFSDYDFQVIQLPLRNIVTDSTLARLP